MRYTPRGAAHRLHRRLLLTYRHVKGGDTLRSPAARSGVVNARTLGAMLCGFHKEGDRSGTGGGRILIADGCGSR